MQDVFGRKSYIATQGNVTPYLSDNINLHTMYLWFKGVNIRFFFFIYSGPKSGTIDDYWRMVWQENARILICLTNISEAKTVR